MELGNVVISARVWVAVLLGLLSFGWAYDKWVASLEEKGKDRGYTAFLVVIGCGVTILGLAVVVWSFWIGLIAVTCFSASGVPMISGSVRRYTAQRAREEAEAKAQVKETLGER